MDTNPDLEIWWDSSPLVYSVWAEGFLKKDPADRAGELREQLKRLYDPEHPEETLFRGVTTNPPSLPWPSSRAGRPMWPSWWMS